MFGSMVSKAVLGFVLIWVQVEAQSDYSANLDAPAAPYSFKYDAGRYPGHVDRTHSEDGDGSGTAYGSYSYVDPSNQYRSVNYVADAHGFHPVLSHAVVDTEAVKAAKQRHLDLFHKIAKEHAAYKHNPEYRVDGYPKDTAAVKNAKHEHLLLWEKIAAEHAKLGAEKNAYDATNNYAYQPDYTTSYY